MVTALRHTGGSERRGWSVRIDAAAVLWVVCSVGEALYQSGLKTSFCWLWLCCSQSRDWPSYCAMSIRSAEDTSSDLATTHVMWHQWSFFPIALYHSSGWTWKTIVCPMVDWWQVTRQPDLVRAFRQRFLPLPRWMNDVGPFADQTQSATVFPKFTRFKPLSIECSNRFPAIRIWTGAREHKQRNGNEHQSNSAVHRNLWRRRQCRRVRWLSKEWRQLPAVSPGTL